MQKSEGSPLILLKSAGVGSVIAAAVSMLLVMLLAALFSAGQLPEPILPHMALPVALLSVFVGALLAARGAGQKRLLVALGVCAIYLLVAFFLRALWFEGEWSVGPAIAAILGALAAGLLSSRRKKRRK